jgi:DNA-binding transcriptional ArsR family regulator
MSKILRILKQLDFSDKEVEVLSYLVVSGDTTVYSMVKHIQLPRQTVYSVLERLTVCGLVTYSDVAGTRRYSSSMSMLLGYIDSQILKYQGIKKVLKNKSAIISKDIPVKRKLIKTRYFSGEYGLAYLFETILSDLSKSESSKLFRGFGVNYFRKTGIQRVIEKFIKKRAQLGVTTELIVGEGDDDMKITPDDQYKRAIKKIDFPEQEVGYYVIDDVVYFFSYVDATGIRIEHKEVAKLMGDIFEYVWRENLSN